MGEAESRASWPASGTTSPASASERLSFDRFEPPAPINARQMWANNRFWMETQNIVTKRYGGRGTQHWYALLFMMKAFEWGLKRCGQFERGRRNAEDIVAAQ